MSRGEIRHLKEYVRSHPDNQMAWYLLGKHYESDNKAGKALYCFLKSRDVYEAFEKKSLPDVEPEELLARQEEADVWREEDERLTRARARLASLRLPPGVWRRSAVAALILLLLFLPPESGGSGRGPDARTASSDGKTTADISAGAGGHSGQGTGQPEQRAGQEEAQPAGMVPGPGVAGRAAAPFRMIYAFGREQMEREAAKAVLGDGPLAEETLLALAPVSADGRWILWTEAPTFVMSSLRLADGRIARLEYYDPSACVCVPADAAASARRFADWQAETEQRIVALSALAQYRAIHGGDPGEMGDIVRPYPFNMLSGYTPLMEAAVLEGLELKPDAADPLRPDQATGRPGLAGEFGAGPDPDGWLREPLEIIVDTANHRLALVAGPVILRSYPVGLGGDKTPRGEFAITEKVRNPNGRADGDFGSRGMTLSDTLYAIHGTNEPDTIGADASLGCVRMLNEDIEELFDMVPLGTKVTIAEGVLPSEILRAAERFRVPPMVDDTNPGKVYRWLN